ncbi:MAG: HDOD domain-containing protein [Pseudomonadales bacterium]|nr:HDOD domain-containing protein [Pseudomonadales bacterium]
MNKETLLENLRHSDQLPMLPDVAVRIIEMSNDSDLYATKVSEVIANDPALSARLLQVSNSSIFPSRHEITNLNQALTILGVQLTMSIAIGFAIIDMMRSRESADSDFNHDAFWRKSVLGAIAAIEMRSELSGVEQGDLFIAALMQDIGMIALETLEGKKYTQIVNGARSHLDLIELERRMFGVDHAEIGAAILERWHLPSMHIQSVRNSHYLLEAKSITSLSELEYAVAFSGLLAEQWIGESSSQHALDDAIQRSLEKIGKQSYKNIVNKTADAVPDANELFKMNLLSPDQLSDIQS